MYIFKFGEDDASGMKISGSKFGRNSSDYITDRSNYEMTFIFLFQQIKLLMQKILKNHIKKLLFAKFLYIFH